MAFLKKNKTDESKVADTGMVGVNENNTEEEVAAQGSMAEKHTVRNNDNENEIVKPTFDTENKRKAIVQISEEQSSYDDMNSLLIEDKKVEQVAMIEGKKEKKKEVNKKLKPIKIAAACIAGAGVVAAGVFIGLNIANKGTDIELKPIDINSQSSNSTSVASSVENTETVPDESNRPKIGESTIGKPMNVGEYYIKNLVANIQETEGAPYKNIDTEYYYGLSEVISGYDNVSKYVDEYNKTASKKIKIGNKEDIANDLSLAMFTINVEFPSTFPSNLGDNMFRDVPDISVRLIGNPVKNSESTDTNSSESKESNSETESVVTVDSNEESESENVATTNTGNSESREGIKDDSEHNTDYITLNGKNYDIFDLRAIYTKDSSVNIKEGGHYRFITTMPVGAGEDNYIIEVKFGDTVMFYNGVEIK